MTRPRDGVAGSRLRRKVKVVSCFVYKGLDSSSLYCWKDKLSFESPAKQQSISLLRQRTHHPEYIYIHR